MSKERLMRSEQQHKQYNYGYLLFLLAAAFSLFNRVRGTELGIAGYFFTSVMAYPGMMFLMGREAREKRQDPHGLRAMGLGLVALSFLQKVLLFWIETILGRGPVFYPFSTSGVPWLLFVGGLGLLLMSFYRERTWTKRLLVPLTALVGVAIGLVKFVGDFMCLSRLVVYLPFLICGFLLEDSQMEKLGKKIWLKWAGLIAVLGWGVFCLLTRSYLGDFRLLVDNNKWYKNCEALPRMLAGVPARALFYVLAFLLLFGVLALIPGKKLPFVTEQGKRWKSGYFWFTPCAYLIAHLLDGKVTGKGVVMAGALALVLLLISCSRRMNSLPHVLVHWTDYAQPGTPSSKKLEGGSLLKKHRWGIQIVVIFTVCFLIGAVGYVFPYFSNGKNLIWQVDGLFQQYPSILYTKNYLLDVLQNFLETGAIHFPQWDFSIGFGLSPADALRREPLSLMFLFATKENLEAFYNFMVVFRMYVCGLTFLWYCWELGKREKLPIVMGAMLFVFADFPILAAVRQPFFVTTLLTYFLLTVIGVERYLQKGKPALFVAVIALQFFNGYYSTYINSVLMAVYLLCRLYGMYGLEIRTILRKIVKMIGWYLWGLAISMSALLPNLMSFLNSSRSGEKIDLDLFYSNGYYEDLFSELGMGYGGLGYRSYVGFASIGLVACILLFLKRKKELRPLKMGLAAVTVFICLPVFGWIFNGFGYITNRWCYAIAFVVAVILVEMTPEMLSLTARERKYMAVTVLVYGALVLTRNEALKDGAYMGIAVLAMTVIVVLMLKDFFHSRRAQMGALAIVTVLNVTFNTAACGLADFGDYQSQSVETGVSYDRIVYYLEDAVEALEEDDSFYRLGRPISRTNQSLMMGYNGVSSYYSVISSEVSEYCIDIGLNTQYQTFLVAGLDERAVPSTLSSMKYYTTNDPNVVPYGFTEIDQIPSVDSDGNDTTCYIYENDYALPLGYTYTTYVTLQEYEAMTALEKQQVMLYGTLLEEETDLLDKQESWYEEEKIPCTVSRTGDLVMDEEAKTMAIKDSGYFFLDFEGKPNCEYYLVFKGLEDQNEEASTSATIRAIIDDYTKEASFRSPSQTYYFNREYLTFHLGYHEQAQNRCRVFFSKDLNLKYEDFYIVCVPMDEYGENASRLGEVVLENIVEEGDYISGTIELEENRLLVLSIPWSSGWKAYVNGEEQELLHANGMYCGLLLTPGSHEIELRYELPGQKTGNLISGLAILAVLPAAGVSLLRRRKENKKS